MNLHLLRIFAAVVEQKSFSRAAEVQGVSQPAVSKAVRELEDQLQVVLLERGGRSFRPSEAGQMLYKYARGIFAMERAAVEAVQAYSELERGNLTIGASTTIAAYWLPGLIADFAKRYPGIRVRLLSGNTRQVAQWLIDCDVDVALVEGGIEDERVEVRPWRRERMLVIAAPDALPAGRALEAGELAGQLWLLREPGSGSRGVVEHELARLGIQPARTLEAGGNEILVQMAAAGLGVAMVPEAAAADAIALGRVTNIPLRSGEISRELFRLRLPRRPVSQGALAFEAMIG
ncbi:MAG: LysR family transcriptional regulator [Candidatus Dactylopiibacterium carminicum]|uniref:LysR family transcriptional regulator n=1 Tax=Candidatus Dactylopiibacterium carminicum TaxID=857335 RepID=A0A272EZ89_9RHOO|nr:LysR family transcriptional regulator [Candidatus Dactylopiibacterium carminicum]KAF7600857.1 LysR family transcriptional regulator [Candidatus Dactylopiibacterium carminicum]PAS95356.1 MAG: LysR family transcriptional regulator [Candidatus Dactylopiibacterium carminicum]PAT00859.1 MAG: LysR family transcriptional regulator [Candidatus Dactylopiibacterium carminicum]